MLNLSIYNKVILYHINALYLKCLFQLNIILEPLSQHQQQVQKSEINGIGRFFLFSLDIEFKIIIFIFVTFEFFDITLYSRRGG